MKPRSSLTSKLAPLKLTVRAIRNLQKNHEIENLLAPKEEDIPKMARLDFLVDFCYEGSRGWESPPSKDDIEEFDIREMSNAMKTVLSAEGND